MDRPVTSRPRGICRYYTTPRGCFAGDDCKFLHGVDEKLTPYDKAKVCRYYARGYCTRGDHCWFRHDLPKIAPDDERIQFTGELCCICLEKPTTYGLLTDCSHVFCLECIRQWRAPDGKSPDVVSSGTIKCCPLCRTSSHFVTPSAHFFPSGSSRKKETIDAYKASMGRVPCRYFEETSRTGKPCCPFGIDCFYQHINPDGTPHVFRHGAKHSMKVYRRHRFRNANIPSGFDSDDPIEFLQHIFDNPITNLHATLDVIRASLPALMERFTSNDPESLDSDEDEVDLIDFSPWEDYLIANDEASFTAVEADRMQSVTVESPPGPTPLPAQIPRLPETPQTIAPLSHEPQPVRVPSRFSTVTSTQTQQTFIIDISDDDEEEEEEEERPTQRTCNAGPINSVDSSRSASMAIPRSFSEQQSNAPQPAGHTRTDMSHSRAQCEHDVDPPFLTDGRGRVVWSSTRNASTRGATADGRAPRHSRTGSTSRIACPSPSSTFLSNTWIHARGGSDGQGIDGKVGGGNESSDME